MPSASFGSFRSSEFKISVPPPHGLRVFIFPQAKDNVPLGIYLFPTIDQGITKSLQKFLFSLIQNQFDNPGEDSKKQTESREETQGDRTARERRGRKPCPGVQGRAHAHFQQSGRQ